MKLRAFLMLGLAVVLGMVAVFLAQNWLQNQTRQAAVPDNQIKLTTVVIAKRPLKLGDGLAAEFLEEVSWPANNVPAGSFTKINDIIGGDAKRVALRSIKVNEPVLREKISGFGGRATLSALIEKEMRGVTIRVNDVLGVAGFVLPGDRVDILLTREIGEKASKTNRITNVLMQNIKVLGIDQEASDDKDQPKVVRAVTLEVSTDEGQKLALASQVGTLSLALRHAQNSDPAQHRTIRVRDLVDNSLIATKKKTTKKISKVFRPRRSTTTSVKVMRGVKATTHEVAIERPGVKRPASSTPKRLTPSKESNATPPSAKKPDVAPSRLPAANPKPKKSAPVVRRGGDTVDAGPTVLTPEKRSTREKVSALTR